MLRVLLAALLLWSPHAEAKNCKTGQPCGNSCISWSKTCHVGSSSSSNSARSHSSSTTRSSSTARSSAPTPTVEAEEPSLAPEAPTVETEQPSPAPEAPTTAATRARAKKTTPSTEPASAVEEVAAPEPVEAQASVVSAPEPALSPTFQSALFGMIYASLVIVGVVTSGRRYVS